jgi:D-arabinose 5-phosphate isomerase GutQ
MKKKSATFSKTKALAAGRAVLAAETGALHAATVRLDDAFARVVELLYHAPGKVVVSGIGKSALVAQSIAATLCSLGTPAAYLHAGEAAHGDIGVVRRGDAVILVSKSGATPELVRLAPALRALGAKLIALTSNPRSPLAEEADAMLDAHVAGGGPPPPPPPRPRADEQRHRGVGGGARVGRGARASAGFFRRGFRAHASVRPIGPQSAAARRGCDA